jgi:hypothetical protein
LLNWEALPESLLVLGKAWVLVAKHIEDRRPVDIGVWLRLHLILILYLLHNLAEMLLKLQLNFIEHIPASDGRREDDLVDFVYLLGFFLSAQLEERTENHALVDKGI